MTNATFKLQDSGFTRNQVEALTEYIDQGVATKADIERLEGKINNLYWMFGVLIAGIASLIIKAFFGAPPGA